MSFFEMVFVGQCEVFVGLDFVEFFPLGREAHRSANGVSILQKMSFFPTPCPLTLGVRVARLWSRIWL